MMVSTERQVWKSKLGSRYRELGTPANGPDGNEQIGQVFKQETERQNLEGTCCKADWKGISKRRIRSKV